MKTQFSKKLKLNPKNKERLNIINDIIVRYQEQGLKLTLRQLYYQLVIENIIPNNSSEYTKLSKLLVEGRMFGIVDWNAIEDRTRRPYIPYSVDDIDDAIEDTINQYRLDRMKDQDVYIEVWVEKDALSGVLRRVTEKYHIHLIVNKGYGSCSSMYDASQRILRAMKNNKQCFILYLGDHDPSGMDMTRDIDKRLKEFEVECEVKRIALTSKQIKKYNPPPNPAKLKDPRSKEYIKEFGNNSWEVDALNPKILNTLVDKEILDLIDVIKYNKILSLEDSDKEKLENFRDNMENEQ
jgi:hypothetical protein